MSFGFLKLHNKRATSPYLAKQNTTHANVLFYGFVQLLFLSINRLEKYVSSPKSRPRDGGGEGLGIIYVGDARSSWSFANGNFLSGISQSIPISKCFAINMIKHLHAHRVVSSCCEIISLFTLAKSNNVHTQMIMVTRYRSSLIA